MAQPRATWQEVIAAAERLTAAGDSPFKREDLVGAVQRLHPGRERGTIDPVIQAMTVNATGGPQVPALARGRLRRVDYGYYELNHAGVGPRATGPGQPGSPGAHPGGQTPALAVVPPAVAQEELPSPPGDAAEQRAAESEILTAASVQLGAQLSPRRLHLADGVRIEVDGVSDSPHILCEVWAHQGSSKVGQDHKVLHDALKLFMAAECLSPRPRLVLAFADRAATLRFEGTSWYAHALRRLDVEILVVDIPDDLRQRIRRAQERQRR
jgi:hypothetical protein